MEVTLDKPGAIATEEQLQQWVEWFHRDGFLVMHNTLTPEHCAELRNDLDIARRDRPAEYGPDLRPRMFEMSNANLRLFDNEPIVSFAEALIDPGCHVIHNNSFITPPGGGLSNWHQDDSSHMLVTHGEPPTNIKLPVILFTANYYLTNVPTVEHGPTQVIPGSHLFGSYPPPDPENTKYGDKIFSATGNMGTVVMFNCQVWHRGGPNQTDTTRYITQVSYARRMVGHRYYPFMNYQMPEHVYADANPRLKRLLGFLPRGPYG